MLFERSLEVERTHSNGLRQLSQRRWLLTCFNAFFDERSSLKD